MNIAEIRERHDYSEHLGAGRAGHECHKDRAFLLEQLEQVKQNMLDAAHIMERDNMQASDAAYYIRKILEDKK
jgi:hypothetical protein